MCVHIHTSSLDHRLLFIGFSELAARLIPCSESFSQKPELESSSDKREVSSSVSESYLKKMILL